MEIKLSVYFGFFFFSCFSARIITLFIYLFETKKKPREKKKCPNKYFILIASVSFIYLSFFCFILFRSQHQDGLGEIGSRENRNAKTLCDGEFKNSDISSAILIKCFFFSYLFQYYEMSYGLNVEMHKQVNKCHLIIQKKNTQEKKISTHVKPELKFFS